MTRTTDFSRRAVLAGGVGLLAAGPALAESRNLAETLTLPVGGGRTSAVTVIRPAEVKGVALFSHGFGGRPANYARLHALWRDAGFLIVAPLHVDSTEHPDREKFDLQAGFAARLADMAAVSAAAQAMAPGKPVVATGHSYGSLIAMMLGGGLAKVAPVRDPAVRAVCAMSSPGKLPGLVGPDGYASLATPLLMVTGDQDLVEGYVADWRDHLCPFETSPAGDKYALILKGADHYVAGGQGAIGAGFANAAETGRDFLQAYGLGDAGAAARLKAHPSTEAARFERR